MKAEEPAEGPVLHLARVIWYSQVDGYGFLAVDGYPRDLFIHNRQVREADIAPGDLKRGYRLYCSIGVDERHRCAAMNVKKYMASKGA